MELAQAPSTACRVRDLKVFDLSDIVRGGHCGCMIDELPEPGLELREADEIGLLSAAVLSIISCAM